MKNEINYSEMLFNRDDRLLNYITNLQTIEREYSSILSENAELENKITNLQEEYEQLEKENKQLKQRNKEIYDGFMVAIDEVCETDREKREYKSRIDKARECINYYAIEDDDFNKLYDVEEQELLEILGDKENE